MHQSQVLVSMYLEHELLIPVGCSYVNFMHRQASVCHLPLLAICLCSDITLDQCEEGGVGWSAAISSKNGLKTRRKSSRFIEYPFRDPSRRNALCGSEAHEREIRWTDQHQLCFFRQGAFRSRRSQTVAPQGQAFEALCYASMKQADPVLNHPLDQLA
jgi:hypothetical protein